MEESSSNLYDYDFVVSLELETNQVVSITFPVRIERTSGIIDRNHYLEEFFQMLGIQNEHEIDNITGRKCVYRDLREKNDDRHKNGLVLMNSKNTRRVRTTAFISWISIGISTVAMLILTVLQSRLGLLLSFGGLILSTVVNGLCFLYLTKYSHSLEISNHSIETH